MSDTIAGIGIPDSPVARAASDLVRAVDTDLLYHHSRRVFLWGSLKANALGLTPDPELSYIAAMFHDLGLTERYRRTDQRFELDGADIAKAFLIDHGYSIDEAQTAWLAIALHTTPGIAVRLAPEVALVTLGVEGDVLGLDLDLITDNAKLEVTTAHPRPNFKRRIQKAFYDGMKDRPDTTFGTMNDDVLARFDPHFRREDFTAIIDASPWSE
ncbi:HD domain-containing protein [Mycolicibacterium sp. HK-90]|uniref:HD domain-containing protein n=1 Tax=Mycolicibacterium sp. HK-90 TaxID=3056937 RepID=UPI002657F465|nr:HD domain-containing protein [Mycolicibacterium sp. HK-90]WKG03923.1 HD domain-containing protein [Mycolicibacterium sp. HK-90]